MRQIERKVVGAFVKGQSASLDNTSTNGQVLWLHNNIIAQWVDGELMFTLAGWNTPTTRSRLNALAQLARRHGVYCKKFVAYHVGEALDDNSWYPMRRMGE